MITEKFLFELGLKDSGNKNLPAWYNIFGENPETKKSPAYVLDDGKDEKLLTIFLSPRGVFGEVCEVVDEIAHFTYHRLAQPEDVIGLIRESSDRRLVWEDEELPF